MRHRNSLPQVSNPDLAPATRSILLAQKYRSFVVGPCSAARY
jgi:hypothetical protein